MASIKKRSNGSYQIRIYLGEDLDGKKLFKNATYKPHARTEKAIEKEVSDYARDFEKRVLNGDYLSGEEMKLNQFFTLWLSDFAPKKLKEAEIEEYESIIKRVFLPTLGNKKIAQISALHLQAICTDLEKQGLKPSTIRKYFTCLSSVLTSAYKASVIRENPCSRVDLPSIENDPNDIRFFDKDQAITFLNALNKTYTVHYPEKKRKNGRVLPAHDETITISTQFRAFFTLAILSGCRRGEIISLTWEDIDLDKCLLKISKNTRTSKKSGTYLKDPKTKAGFRTLSLPVSCIHILRQWKEEEKRICEDHGSAWKGSPLEDFDKNFIFIQNDGAQMHLSTPTHKFAEILGYYNDSVSDPEDQLPVIKLHDLRHTSASLMISSGYVDIETIARRMGHSDVKMTLNRYGHALPSQDEKAALALEISLDLTEKKTDLPTRKEASQQIELAA